MPGRFLWVCYYLILIYGIIIIYKSCNKKTSILFLSTLVIIQIADISIGLKEYINGKSFNNEKIVLQTEKDAETDPEMDFDNQGSTDKVKQMAKSAMNRRK